jgi:hypothetical protein
MMSYHWKKRRSNIHEDDNDDLQGNHDLTIQSKCSPSDQPHRLQGFSITSLVILKVGVTAEAVVPPAVELMASRYTISFP